MKVANAEHTACSMSTIFFYAQIVMEYSIKENRDIQLISSIHLFPSILHRYIACCDLL